MSPANNLLALGERNRLVLCAADVAALDVDRRILIGEPVDQRVTELVLGHERAVGGSAQHQDVEPADVIGNEQAVSLDGRALQLYPGPGDPARGSEERRWPGRAPEHYFGDDVDRRDRQEQQGQSGDADCRAWIHACGLSDRGRG